MIWINGLELFVFYMGGGDWFEDTKQIGFLKK